MPAAALATSAESKPPPFYRFFSGATPTHEPNGRLGGSWGLGAKGAIPKSDPVAALSVAVERLFRFGLGGHGLCFTLEGQLGLAPLNHFETWAWATLTLEKATGDMFVGILPKGEGVGTSFSSQKINSRPSFGGD